MAFFNPLYSLTLETTGIYGGGLEEDQIRLIRILPCLDSDDSLACLLFTHSLDALPPFSALSYAWGHQERTVSIAVRKVPEGTFLRSEEFFITSNLETALRQIRDIQGSGSILFWCDAICINQNDAGEKNRQVARMAKIYGKADEVFISLGPENSYSFLAIGLVKELQDLENFDRSLTPEYSWTWGALVELMKRDWFSRRWVVQELAWARQAILLCGQDAVDWSAFAQAVDLFKSDFDNILRLITMRRHTGASPQTDIRALPATTMVSLTSAHFREVAEGSLEPLSSLETLVTELSRLQASDPRDAIFAFLSIARDVLNRHPKSQSQSLPVSMEADSTQDVLTVFKNFMAFCVVTSGSLDILCRNWALNTTLKEGEESPDSVSIVYLELPSWMGLIEDSSLGAPEKYLSSRRYAESLVGLPRSKKYQASGTTNAEVMFSEESKFQFTGKDMFVYISGLIN